MAQVIFDVTVSVGGRLGVVSSLARRFGWPRVAPGLVSFGVLASVGLADGGLFPRTWRLATFALLAVAAAALIARERVAIARLEWLMLTALLGFGAWIALSATWSGRPSASLLEAERTLLYVAALFAIFTLVERSSVPHLLGGALAGISVASAYGLAIYFFTSPPLDPFEGGLLYQPLGYANALGIFDAIGIVLAIGLAFAARRRAACVCALLPLLVLVPSLLLTSSRGAWLALACAAALLAFLTEGSARWRVAVGGSVAAMGVIAAAAVLTHRAGADFLANRRRYWEVAWADYMDNPLLGSGAGTFGEYWLRHASESSFTRTAHNLYLQSLAELGPLGVALVVAALAAPLCVLRRRDSRVAVAAAGFVAFVLHAGVDWDWEMPAVTLAGLVCGGAVLVACRDDRVGELKARTRLALALASLALAITAATRLYWGGDLTLVGN